MCNQVNGASVIPTLPPVRLFKHCVGKRVKTIFLMQQMEYFFDPRGHRSSGIYLSD